MPHNFWTINLFLAWYGLLESYIDSLLYKKVSENPKNYCTCRSLPKSAKTSFHVDCPLGVKIQERYYEKRLHGVRNLFSNPQTLGLWPWNQPFHWNPIFPPYISIEVQNYILSRWRNVSISNHKTFMHFVEILKSM
jgi:hypothetical protein